MERNARKALHCVEEEFSGDRVTSGKNTSRVLKDISAMRSHNELREVLAFVIILRESSMMACLLMS